MRPESDGSDISFPAKIQIQTINHCNYACSMCPYPSVSKDLAVVRLDSDLFMRLIEQVRDSRRRVKLCLMLQNEPLLDRRFLDFLDYAHQAVDAIQSISAVTNGSTLNPSMLDTFTQYERLRLTVSINATDRARYEKVHNRDGWDAVHDLLAEWGGARQRVRVSCVVNAESVEHARKFYSYWTDLGYPTRFVPENSRVGELDKTLRIHRHDPTFGHCHYPVDTLTVLADGSVILCCNDWRHAEAYGNLHQATIAELWNGPRLRALRKAALDGKLRENNFCRDCDYPARSSERVRLEALLFSHREETRGVGEYSPLALATSPRTIAHETTLECDGKRVAVLVCDLDESAGTALVLLPRSVELLGSAAYEFRIGYSAGFDFGSLAPVICSVTLRHASEDIDINGYVPVHVHFDQTVAAFRFFRWYCQDWAAS